MASTRGETRIRARTGIGAKGLRKCLSTRIARGMLSRTISLALSEFAERSS